MLADYALHEPSVRVRTVFGASDELADHLLAGAQADLFLTADPGQFDRLRAHRLLTPEVPTILAGNTLAAVALADRPQAVRRPSDLGRPDLRRIALAAPRCPLGRYTRAYLDGLGLYDALSRRALEVDNARAVLAAVRAGRADVGLAYGSDAAYAVGCRLLFRVRRLPQPIRYAGAVLALGRNRERARALLSFLSSPAATHRFRCCGFLSTPAGN